MTRLALVILSLLLLSATSFAQTQAIKVSDDAVRALLSKLLQSNTPEDKSLTNAAAEEEPRFIFIPGVFGSKIWAIDENDVKTHDIWNGELFNTQSLQLVDGEQVETAPLDQMEALVGVDIYGKSLDGFASKSMDAKLFTSFSYDWRRDLVYNAAALQVWLCKNRASFEGHPVYIIAHSMGGLIVKYWQKEVRTLECDTSGWLNVKEIILLGAPLYGAPAALASFAEGVDLSNGALFGVVSNFDAASRALNEFGATFPSAYELLPIYRQSCFAAHQRTQPPLYLRSADGTTTPIDNIFDADTWRSLGWPKKLPDGCDRETYYATMLPTFLGNAETFLCKLASFDLNSKVKTTYFYGVLPALTTISALEVSKSNDGTVVARDCMAAANGCLEQGDGTVPLIIASNGLAAEGRETTRSTPDGHQNLLKSSILADYVNRILDEQALVGMFKVAMGDAPSRKALYSAAVDAKVILPMTLPGSYGADAAALNLATLDSLKVTADDISFYAAAAVTSKEVNGWTNVLKILPDADPETIFRGFDRAGTLAVGMGDWQAALDAYDRAIDQSIFLPQDVAKRTVPGIYLQQGGILAKLGDEEAATAKFTSAQELGGPDYKLVYQPPLTIGDDGRS